MPSIYGIKSRNKKFLTNLINNAKNNNAIKIFNPNLKFNNAILIDNCVDFYLHLINNPKLINGYNLNLGTSDSLKMNEISNLIVNICKSKSKIMYIKRNKGNYLQDISKAVNLGFKPNTFNEIINYFKSNLDF